MPTPVWKSPLTMTDLVDWGVIPTMIEGQSRTSGKVLHKGPEGRSECGLWICTPGKWYVEYVKWEYCDFREGYCIITPEGKEPIHLRAGDIFVIEPGMKGTWEVVETVRKYFVFA